MKAVLLTVVLLVSLAVGARAQAPAGVGNPSVTRGNDHHALGRRFLEQGDVIGAIRELRQATVLLPNVGRVHYDYGRALAADGDKDEAVKEFRLAIKFSQDDPDPHVAIATLLPSTEAIAEYRAALRLKPDYPEARRGLGNRLLMTQVLEMLQAIGKAGGSSLTAKERASVQNLFVSLRQTQAGFAELRKAIELSPRWALPHHDLATALKLFGDQRGASAEYQIACSLEPANEKFCADYRDALAAR